MCKEELLTDVKNLLYHRTNDVERLQKVISDTEQQFADCLQQVKTLGEERGSGRRNWKLSRKPPRNWWTWWIHLKKAKQTRGPC
jgi:hypothetical protein